jgi:hypothetical protein
MSEKHAHGPNKQIIELTISKFNQTVSKSPANYHNNRSLVKLLMVSRIKEFQNFFSLKGSQRTA